MDTPPTPPPFVPSPEYLAREKRFNDAIALRKPDRVPVASLAAFFMARYGGIDHATAMYDYDKLVDAWKYTTQKLDFDMAPPPFTMFSGKVFELLGLQTFKWPGGELGRNLPYQFVEKEYMLQDEYDAFLKNPTDFVLRTMMPRMATSLAPLGMLPPLHWLSSGYTLFMLGATFAGIPPIAGMLQQIIKVGEEMNRWNGAQARLGMELAQMGYPMITAAFAEAPFDWMSDMFRGLRGAMLDMYRVPDKLKAAMALCEEFAIQSALMIAQQSGNPRIFIPLHRGAAGFMSNKQFGEFYWPGLKRMMLALIDHGLTPMPFWEGDYTPRLDFLAELPPGKVCGHFDVVDIKQAKAKLGDVMCFWGNVPAQTLVTGTPQQVTDYVRTLIDTFGDTGGLIIDGAVDGVPPESKPENVEAMVAAAHKYGVY